MEDSPQSCNDLTRRVRAEQVKVLYANSPSALLAVLVNAPILTAIQWEMVSHSVAMAWLSCMAAITSGRFALSRQFGKASPSPFQMEPWRTRFLLGTTLSGLVWGIAGWVFFPEESIPHQVFLALVLAGVTAGAVSAFSSVMSVFLLFTIPTLLPLIIRFVIEGTRFHLAMGIMAALFAILMTWNARNMHRAILTALTLQFKNEGLVASLTARNVQVEKLNAELRAEMSVRHRAEEALRRAHDGLELRVQERTEDLAQANKALQAEVTERQRAEEALQESMERFELAVRGSQDGLWDATAVPDDYFNPRNPIYYSPRFKALLGYDDHEFDNVIGSWASRLHSDDRERVFEALHRHLEQRVPYDIEYRMFTKSGECRWFVARGAAIWDHTGRPVRMSGSFSDITERKRLEEQLRQAQKLEAIGRLAGGVAHDFNNVLTIIIGHSTLLLKRLEPLHPLRRHAEQIRKASERCAALTGQLLAFSRRQIVVPKILDVQAVITDLAEMLRSLLGEDIVLTVHLGPAPVWVKADPVQLQQILLNLAANAHDAMPQGGTLTVQTATVEWDELRATRYRVMPEGSYARLTVRDTGCGMDAETTAHIFEPFFTTKEIGKGTGLGLATVYGIVQRNGGHIEVDSTPGQGATFTIYLPRVEATEALAPLPMAPEPTPAFKTVLLVDDDPGVRELAQDILMTGGYLVLETGNGTEAVRLCEQHEGPIHLLLTDIVMPQMSGQELAERVAVLRPAIKILFMSGYATDEMLRRNTQDIHIPLLRKPFSQETLERMVREVFGSDLMREGADDG